jgi:hypothetical protein
MSTAGFKVTTDMQPYIKELAKVEGGLALAAAETLNTVGSFAHAQSIRNMHKDFILRNHYSEGSMRAYPVNYKRSNGQVRDIARMKYITGTVSPYLPLQESGGVQKARKKFIPMPTLAGRGGSKSKAIPASLRLDKLGPRAFVLSPSNGAPRVRHGKVVPHTLTKAAIFYRKSKHRLVKLRLVDEKTQRVKPTHWHTEAVRRYGTYAVISTAYVQAAKRILAGDVTAF